MTSVQITAPAKNSPADGQPRVAWFRGRRTWLWACLATLILVCGWNGQSWAVWLTNFRAQAAIAGRDYDRAWLWLERSSQISPADAYAEFLRARVQRHLGQNIKTRDHLKRAAELGFPIKRLEREQYLAAAQNGQLREAMPHFSELLTDPGDDGAEICEAFCQGFYRTRHTRELYRTLEPWMQDFPHDYFPWYLRGRANRDMQQYHAAEKDLQEALKRKPNDPVILYELAECQLNLKRPAEALELFRQSHGNKLVDELSYAGEGRALLMLARADEARTVLQDALKQHPESPSMSQLLGQLELEAGNYAAALNALDLCLKVQENNVEMHNSRAAALRGLKRTEEAKAEYDYVKRARAALDKAQILIDQIERKEIAVAERYEVGEIYLNYSIPGEGVRWLLSVLDIEPAHQATHRTLMDYYQKQAQKDPTYQQWVDYHRSFLRNSASAPDGVPADDSGM